VLTAYAKFGMVVNTSLLFGKGRLFFFFFSFFQSARVQFPRRNQVTQSNHPHPQPNEINNVPNTDQAPTRQLQVESQTVAESR